ncbi:MAG: substrate-binding domain-containing protein, partial [Lachnospiraceae bacterium]|nr:substrate-binding domain-containing protein [Lachnospiraceae bacterium]
MKKALVIALSLGMILSAVACGQKSEPAATTAAPAPAQTEAATTAAAPAAAPAAAETGETLKIAYLVSDMKETFHQASYEAAKEYAKEKYGADVIAFDGAGDAADQIAMLDQFGAQGIDMATMHVWENDAALPALKELLDDGVICASFFGPIPGSGVPAVRN